MKVITYLDKSNRNVINFSNSKHVHSRTCPLLRKGADLGWLLEISNIVIRSSRARREWQERFTKDY